MGKRGLMSIVKMETITAYNNEQLNTDYKAERQFNNYFFSGAVLPPNNTLNIAIMQGFNLA